MGDSSNGREYWGYALAAFGGWLLGFVRWVSSRVSRNDCNEKMVWLERKTKEDKRDSEMWMNRFDSRISELDRKMDELKNILIEHRIQKGAV